MTPDEVSARQAIALERLATGALRAGAALERLAAAAEDLIKAKYRPDPKD